AARQDAGRWRRATESVKSHATELEEPKSQGFVAQPAARVHVPHQLPHSAPRRLAGRARLVHGRVALWRREDCGQESGFRRRDVPRFATKVVERRVPYAVERRAVLDDVEVELENPVLVERPLEP